MTLEELKKTIYDTFDPQKMPDYMKTADVFFFTLARNLWAMEYSREKEVFKDASFDMLVTLPMCKFYNLQGGRYMELYMHSITKSDKPLTDFLRRAIPSALQQADMQSLDAYRDTLVKHGG